MVPIPSDGFPSIAWCARLGGPKDDIANRMLFDVKFWPWPDHDDEESIFAVTGGCDTFVCRTKENADPPFEVLRWWREDDSFSFNSICWTKDEAGNPLLCAAGSSPKSIIVYSVTENAKIRTIPGHGRAINDLQISPLSPFILASASEDYSVRLWNLSPAYEAQPCVAILAGQGHKQPLLTLDFHPNGKWLLSGGMDTAVALWVIPPLSALHDPSATEPENPDREPLQIFYPSFISEEIHTNFVDCVKFYGDCILSRAARGQSDVDLKENEILLWRIEGFSSSLPPPKAPPIPYPGTYTRSAFPHSDRSRGFQRLLTFAIQNTPRFYLRFGLFHQPGRRPLLAMATEKSKFLFWDLQRCEEGEDPEVKKAKRGRKPKAAVARGGSINADSLSRLGGRKGRRETSIASDSTSAFHPQPARSSTSHSVLPALTPTAHSRSASTSQHPAISNSEHPDGGANTTTNDDSGTTGKCLFLDDPFNPLKPHLELLADTKKLIKDHFACAQVEWSRDGKWCVGVGDWGTICVFRR